ncbi:glycosyltransferase family 1 protein [soil metagenome]
MIRVGFRLIGGAAWQGGRNYLWNLLHAVTHHAAERIQPVLLLAPDEDAGDLEMRGVEIVRTDRRFDSPRVRTIGRVVELATRCNPIEKHWVRKASLDVISHGPPVGGVPSVAWVPDLQHRQLPHLASRREHFMRDLLFREMLRDARVVVTSSETTLRDLAAFYPAGRAERRVLRFVSQPRLSRERVLTVDQLRTKFRIPARFFHLPNQLWKHKNHELVVDALRSAPDAVVVATGPREDYRHAGVYGALMDRVKKNGLGDRFFHLGLVSFPELISLMHHSVAVINPSRFEGWSSTVEEAKSLGKRVLVSDLDVHREQDAPRARYFGVDDATALAHHMAAAWETHDVREDEVAASAAAAALPDRTRAFADTYASIVADALKGRR